MRTYKPGLRDALSCSVVSSGRAFVVLFFDKLV